MDIEFFDGKIRREAPLVRCSPPALAYTLIENLRIAVRVDTIFDGFHFSNFISWFPNLYFLSLTHNKPMASVLQVEAMQLQKLSLEDFFHTAELSLDCPNLEVFAAKVLAERRQRRRFVIIDRGVARGAYPPDNHPSGFHPKNVFLLL